MLFFCIGNSYSLAASTNEVFGERRQSDPSNVSTMVIFSERNPIAAVLCKGLASAQIVTQAIAVLVVIIMGIAFILGKISWGVVIATIIGVTMALSSEAMVGTFVGKAGGSDDTNQNACDCKYGVDCAEDE